jgi:hypothetical protein
MTTTVHATFDGKVFQPDDPLPLPANTRVVLTITTPDAVADNPGAFLRTARGLALRGPADWSERVDDYLYSGDENAGE